MAVNRQDVVEWENVSIIGKGGSSTVFKAISKPLGEHIAVKQIDIDGMTKDQLIGIRAEIDTMKSLSHPNIVSYLGMQLKPNKVFILMEFASLGSLRHHYQRKGPFMEKYVRYCLEHIVDGLNYLHTNGIAHRDVKCANCLISNNGVVKLADFGASKKFESQSIVSGLKGTPHWMAPEVIKGTQMTTGWIKADVWSLGCTIVEMYTGKVPYSEYENPMTAMYKIANGEIPSLQRKNSPDVSPSPDLQSFVQMCCAVDPTNRPSLQDLSVHIFLSPSSSAACLSSNEIQSFFYGETKLEMSELPAVLTEEIQHSEMFSPDPSEAVSAAHLVFSSVDTVATLNKSGGASRRGMGGQRSEVTEAEEEEQHYEDDWSDGELNQTEKGDEEEHPSSREDLSRCVTRQAHTSSPSELQTQLGGKRLELASSSSAVSLEFGELPTPLMGAGRKALIRYDSEASIGDNNDRPVAAVGARGFAVPHDLVSELQSVEEQEHQRSLQQQQLNDVPSFDRASEVYRTMMNKYSSGNSSSSVNDGTTVKEAPVVPNLSPVKVKSVKEPDVAAVAPPPPSSSVVVQPVDSSVSVRVEPERDRPLNGSVNKFGFSPSTSAVPKTSSSSHRSTSIPVPRQPAKEAAATASPMEVVPSSGLVSSPPSAHGINRPNAPFSGEKLRIHNYSNNSLKDSRGAEALRGGAGDAIGPQEKLLTGAALRKKAAQELQEAQLAGKQHPHQHALLRIKPSHHVHTGGVGGGGATAGGNHSSSSHKPPSKRVRREKPSDSTVGGGPQQIVTSGGLTASEGVTLNIEEVVRDLHKASQTSKAVKSLGASSGSAARSHSAGVASSLGESLLAGVGTPQHRNRLPPVSTALQTNADSERDDDASRQSGASGNSCATNPLGARYIQSAPAVSRSMNLPPIKENVYGSKTPKMKPNRLYNSGVGPSTALSGTSSSIVASAAGRASPGTMMHSTSSVEILGLGQVQEEE